MAYRSRFDNNGDASSLGENAEKLFLIAAKKHGIAVTEAPLQDQFKHIDFYVDIGGDNKISVEVKSRKKIKRSDTNINDEYVWVEFKNVQGNRGWLYGKADCVAFERENDFLIVNRKLLARLCEKLCDLTKINTDVKLPLYTGYQRRNRNDLVSLIKMSDILDNIKYKLLKK